MFVVNSHQALPKGKPPWANFVFAPIGPKLHNDKKIAPAHAPSSMPFATALAVIFANWLETLRQTG